MHNELINLLTDSKDKKLLSQVLESLKKHYFAELDNYVEKNELEAANGVTEALMSLAFLERMEGKRISCEDLKQIDGIWKKHSKGRFGIGVQKKIWFDTRNRQERETWETYRKFHYRLVDGLYLTWSGVHTGVPHTAYEEPFDDWGYYKMSGRIFYATLYSRARDCQL